MSASSPTHAAPTTDLEWKRESRSSPDVTMAAAAEAIAKLAARYSAAQEMAVDPVEMLVRYFALNNLGAKALHMRWWTKAHLNIDNLPKLRKILKKDSGAANAVDALGNSPLIYAIKYRNAAAVRALLQGGANVTLRGTQGKVALHWAARQAQNGGVESGKIAELLVKAGAKLDVTDRFGRTPLFYALMGGHVEVIGILLRAGASAGLVECPLGLSALHLAVLLDSADLVRLLLLHGADPNASTKNGLTPFALAYQRGPRSVALAHTLHTAAVKARLQGSARGATQRAQ